MTTGKVMLRGAWNKLDAVAKADFFREGGTLVDEPPEKVAAEEQRNAAIATGAITRVFFDSLDAEGKADFFRQGGRVID